MDHFSYWGSVNSFCSRWAQRNRKVKVWENIENALFYALQSTSHQLFLVEWFILGILLMKGSDSICLLQGKALSQWAVLLVPDNNKWSQSDEEPGGILLTKPSDASTSCSLLSQFKWRMDFLRTVSPTKIKLLIWIPSNYSDMGS